MNENNQFHIRCFAIPPEVAFNKSLDKTCMLLFVLIQMLDNARTHCFASNKFLASILNVNFQTISSSIALLTAKGYIEQVSFDGRKRVLRVLPSFREKYKYLMDECDDRLTDCRNGKYSSENLKKDYDDGLMQGSANSEPCIQDYSANAEPCVRKTKNIIKKNKINKRICLEKGTSYTTQPTKSVVTLKKLEEKNKMAQENNKPVFKVKRLPPCPKVTKEIKEILDYWTELDLKKKIPSKDTYSYIELITFIEELLNGKLFSGFKKNKDVIRKYSVEEIKQGMKNFAIKALDKDYLPANKSLYQSISPQRFFYNKLLPREETKSMFLTSLLERPKKVSDQCFVKNEYPFIVERLDVWYRKTLPKNELVFADLIASSKRLASFYRTNMSKMPNIENHFDTIGVYEPIPFLTKHLTRMFDQMLRENPDLYNMISSSWLKSDKTFETRFPNYLKKLRILL